MFIFSSVVVIVKNFIEKKASSRLFRTTYFSTTRPSTTITSIERHCNILGSKVKKGKILYIF